MKMSIRVLLPEERNYTYTQSQQLLMQTGCIGHLRGDMDSNGTGFFTSWDDHNNQKNNDELKAEFNNVVDALRFDERFGGLLKNRSSLAAYCHANPDSAFTGDYSEKFGFRADTEKYSYMIRCNPEKGEYNFYIYAYERQWLDRHMKNASKGIRFIDSGYNEKFRIPDGDKIQITLSDGEKMERICRYIDEYHLEVGSNLFHICEFAERMEQAGNTVIPIRSSLPEQCYSTLPDTDEVIIIKRGESGYHKTDVQGGQGAMRRFADEMNGKLGVSKAQEAAMLAGSMFGWQVPGADPRNYNEDGKPVPTKHKEKGDAR